MKSPQQIVSYLQFLSSYSEISLLRRSGIKQVSNHGNSSMVLYRFLDSNFMYNGNSLIFFTDLTSWLLSVLSMVQILFNKAVLDQMKFPYPMFLTTWHMFVATILTQIMARTTSMLPGVKEVEHQPLSFRSFFKFVLNCFVCFRKKLIALRLEIRFCLCRCASLSVWFYRISLTFISLCHISRYYLQFLL